MARILYRQPAHALARGRNGAFIPRVLEYEFSEHPDGTLLITVRVFSRRASGAAPIELTIPVREWESHVLAIQLEANEAFRRREAARRHNT